MWLPTETLTLVETLVETLPDTPFCANAVVNATLPPLEAVPVTHLRHLLLLLDVSFVQLDGAEDCLKIATVPEAMNAGIESHPVNEVDPRTAI